MLGTWPAPAPQDQARSWGSQSGTWGTEATETSLVRTAEPEAETLGPGQRQHQLPGTQGDRDQEAEKSGRTGQDRGKTSFWLP